MNNKFFKILSILLTYPEAEIKDNIQELGEIANEHQDQKPEACNNINQIIAYYQDTSLTKLQADYVNTFDYSKRHSLNIFEHVHGVSKKRGQAMSDLIDVYKKHGMELDIHEMPDYLPIFFEFISTLNDQERDYYLGQVIEIVSILEHNLAKINSPWHHVMTAALALTSVKAQHTAENIKQYADLKTLDEAYEEPAAFDNGQLSDCGSCDVSAQCSTKTPNSHSVEA